MSCGSPSPFDTSGLPACRFGSAAGAPAADKIPYLTGANTAELADFKALGRALLASSAVPAADKLAYLTGANSADLVDFKLIARQFVAANFFPVQQGGGAGQSANKIYIGWDGGLRAQVDNVDLGAIWSNYSVQSVRGAAGYRLYPNGDIEQWGVVSATSGADITVAFPFVFPNVVEVALTGVRGYPIETQLYSAICDSITKNGMNVRRRKVVGGTVSPDTTFSAQWYARGTDEDLRNIPTRRAALCVLQ